MSFAMFELRIAAEHENKKTNEKERERKNMDELVSEWGERDEFAYHVVMLDACQRLNFGRREMQ